MIPNSAPMAAVYRHAHDNRLSSHPIAAWEEDGAPMVCFETRLRWASEHPDYPDVELLGVWQYGWHPAPDEMATLLPQPAPEEILVTARELTDGSWLGYRTVNGVTIATAPTLGELGLALERHHLDCTIEKVMLLGGNCTEDHRRPVCTPFHTDDCPYV